MVISVNRHNFKQEVEQSDKPVIVEVYAIWCGPCQHIAPLFEELSKKYSDKYKFAKLNVDESREIAVSYGITHVPTFLFLKNGELLDILMGSTTKEDLEKRISELLG